MKIYILMPTYNDSSTIVYSLDSILSFILSLSVFDDFYSELFYYFRMYLYIVCAMSFLISMYTGLNLSHNKKVNYE